MADKRVNVLVYSGPGTTVDSVKHTLWSLRRLLGPNYAVLPITETATLNEPWQSTCALFVIPGGADLGYCRVLNGAGNRKISAYVNKGGRYLGFCAGGYYAAAKCEFEVGKVKEGMEVVGSRELAFYPGTCRGLAFPGFVYHSENGTRAVEVSVNKEALVDGGGAVPEVFRTYYNGGGVFVDVEKYKDRGVQVLASYTEQLNVDSGEGAAAVVYCKVGDGAAVLTGPHPEFAAVNLNKRSTDRPDYADIVDALAADDKQRVDFMKACLGKLGLQVNNDPQGVPSLSSLHLSSADPADTADLVAKWTDIVTTTSDGQEVIKGENDTFILDKPDTWNVKDMANALPDAVKNVLPISRDTEDSINVSKANPAEPEDEGMIDYDAVPKRLAIHTSSIPTPKTTPYFNHAAFFTHLTHYNSTLRLSDPTFGKNLLYGEVVTSTNTILEKNPTLLATLPQGFTATATTQLAGRGRGNNVWVSPPGSLMFSTLLRHPLSMSAAAPVVFIQYLAALAIVQGIHSYDRGYDVLPVHLKWPNDIYALSPTVAKPSSSSAAAKTTTFPPDAYVKIGGILVNSSYTSNAYTLVVGAGLNLSNAAPTTSLNALAASARLPPFSPERLLASILARFEVLHRVFLARGFGGQLLDEYYRLWLHDGQVVTLEAEGGVRARIKGITRDWGMLVAEELGWEDRPTGKSWELQSDANSFDFFRGLLRRKT